MSGVRRCKGLTMSVLTIAQNVARETGFNVPSALVGSADEISVQLLALITAEASNLSQGIIAGRDVAADFYWQALVTRGTITFVNGTEAYNFPADYNASFLPQTMWNNTTGRPIIVPLSAREFEIQKNYLITSGIDYMVYVYGNQFHFVPLPSSTDSLVYEYISTYYFRTVTTNVAKAAITADSDYTAIDENLIKLGVKVRFLQAKGLMPTVGYENAFEYKDYIGAVERAMLKDGAGRPTISMVDSCDAWWLAAYTPDSNWPQS